MSTRTATVTRTTRETSIRLTLDLDGSGQTTIKTGIGFLDHLLDALGRHARFDLKLTCEGDLQVDDHHTGAWRQSARAERGRRGGDRRNRFPAGPSPARCPPERRGRGDESHPWLAASWQGKRSC